MAITYEPIATTTVSGTTTYTVTFTSIPSTYTDLVLVSNAGASVAGSAIAIQFNSDTAANYSFTYLTGDGSSATSGRQTSKSNGVLGWNAAMNTAIEYNTITSIQNYANTTTYKTYLSRANRASASNYPGTEAVVGLWRKTPEAINRIDLYINGTTTYFIAGSTFTLYGIKAA